MTVNDQPPAAFDFTKATEDFNRAKNKAIISKIANIMNSQRDDLLSFHDVKEILKPKNQVYWGMKQVPIKLIVGSEGRYRDFNKGFHPRSEFLRARWEMVDRANLKDIPLPAIQLYEIGGAYFVRDGNHRVSVARSQGVEEIDAEVISLSSEITITSSMTTDDLREAVINLEKSIFYEKTNFEELTGDKELNFTTTGRYDKIYEHILEHKYYQNQDSDEEISFSDALVSWYNEIYKPIIRIINEQKIITSFPGKSPSDLYIWIVRHWDFFKKKYGADYPVADAAKNFCVRYGIQKKSLSNLFKSLLGKFLKRG
jgi:hypothetical protein